MYGLIPTRICRVRKDVLSGATDREANLLPNRHSGRSRDVDSLCYLTDLLQKEEIRRTSRKRDLKFRANPSETPVPAELSFELEKVPERKLKGERRFGRSVPGGTRINEENVTNSLASIFNMEHATKQSNNVHGDVDGNMRFVAGKCRKPGARKDTTGRRRMANTTELCALGKHGDFQAQRNTSTRSIRQDKEEGIAHAIEGTTETFERRRYSSNAVTNRGLGVLGSLATVVDFKKSRFNSSKPYVQDMGDILDDSSATSKHMASESSQETPVGSMKPSCSNTGRLHKKILHEWSSENVKNSVDSGDKDGKHERSGGKHREILHDPKLSLIFQHDTQAERGEISFGDNGNEDMKILNDELQESPATHFGSHVADNEPSRNLKRDFGGEDDASLIEKSSLSTSVKKYIKKESDEIIEASRRSPSENSGAQNISDNESVAPSLIGEPPENELTPTLYSVDCRRTEHSPFGQLETDRMQIETDEEGVVASSHSVVSEREASYKKCPSRFEDVVPILIDLAGDTAPEESPHDRDQQKSALKDQTGHVVDALPTPTQLLEFNDQTCVLLIRKEVAVHSPRIKRPGARVLEIENVTRITEEKSSTKLGIESPADDVEHQYHHVTSPLYCSIVESEALQLHVSYASRSVDGTVTGPGSRVIDVERAVQFSALRDSNFVASINCRQKQATKKPQHQYASLHGDNRDSSDNTLPRRSGRAREKTKHFADEWAEAGKSKRRKRKHQRTKKQESANATNAVCLSEEKLEDSQCSLRSNGGTKQISPEACPHGAAGTFRIHSEKLSHSKEGTKVRETTLPMDGRHLKARGHPQIGRQTKDEQLDWTDDEVGNLRKACQDANPVSKTYWLDVSQKISGRSASECQDKWFSLAKTPKVNRKAKTGRKNKDHTMVGGKGPSRYSCGPQDDEEDDIFSSTPLRGLFRFGSSFMGKNDHPFKNGFDLGSPALGEFEEDAVVDQTDEYEDEIQVKPDRAKTGLKTYIKVIKRGMANANAKRSKKAKQSHRSRAVSVMAWQDDLEFSAKFTPGGTLRLRGPKEDVDDDLFDDYRSRESEE